MLVKKQRLEEIICELLRVKGIELVELKWHSFGRRDDLKVIVDKPCGITLDECADLNRQIIRIIEDNNLLTEQYIIEVCSPGLDRPLKSGNDFLRVLGKELRILTTKPVDGKNEFTGRLKSVNNNVLELEMKDNMVNYFKTDDILKANLEIRW